MARGEVEIELGGKVRVLRFRTRETRALDKLCPQGLTKILSDGQFGPDFLCNAITVGVAHEFAGKRGGQALTERKVEQWIDEYDGDFAGLMSTVIEAVVAGLPGKAVSEEEEEKSPLV